MSIISIADGTREIKKKRQMCRETYNLYVTISDHKSPFTMKCPRGLPCFVDTNAEGGPTINIQGDGQVHTLFLNRRCPLHVRGRTGEIRMGDGKTQIEYVKDRGTVLEETHLLERQRGIYVVTRSFSSGYFGERYGSNTLILGFIEPNDEAHIWLFWSNECDGYQSVFLQEVIFKDVFFHHVACTSESGNVKRFETTTVRLSKRSSLVTHLISTQGYVFLSDGYTSKVTYPNGRRCPLEDIDLEEFRDLIEKNRSSS
jgi:hypothetical protein